MSESIQAIKFRKHSQCINHTDLLQEITVHSSFRLPTHLHAEYTAYPREHSVNTSETLEMPHLDWYRTRVIRIPFTVLPMTQERDSKARREGSHLSRDTDGFGMLTHPKRGACCLSNRSVLLQDDCEALFIKYTVNI